MVAFRAISILYAVDGDLYGVTSNALEAAMLDVIFLAIGIGFFAAAILYVAACERL